MIKVILTLGFRKNKTGLCIEELPEKEATILPVNSYLKWQYYYLEVVVHDNSYARVV